MARYDVKVSTTITHMLAVEADNLLEAQDAGLNEVAKQKPSKMETIVEIEGGGQWLKLTPDS